MVEETIIDEYRKRAEMHIERYEFGDAEFFFKKMIKNDPSLWEAWFGRGLCFKWLDNYEQAMYCFDKLVGLNPEFKKGWYNRGFCLGKLGKFEAAVYSLNRAIQMDSIYNMAYLIKAWVLKAQGNSEFASKLVKKVRDLDPTFEEYLRNKVSSEITADFHIAYELIRI